jgi:hypothetical protein
MFKSKPGGWVGNKWGCHFGQQSILDDRTAGLVNRGGMDSKSMSVSLGKF